MLDLMLLVGVELVEQFCFEVEVVLLQVLECSENLVPISPEEGLVSVVEKEEVLFAEKMAEDLVEIHGCVNGQDQEPNALLVACQLPGSFGVVYMCEFDRIKLGAEGLLDKVPPVMDFVSDVQIGMAFDLINHLSGLVPSLLFTSVLDVVQRQHGVPFAIHVVEFLLLLTAIDSLAEYWYLLN